MNPKISVIIPGYNSGEYIGRAIESALNQSYSPYEVIVVDDGSLDNTVDVIKSYKVTCVCKANGGAASARNAGIEVAKGNWISFLDSDDHWKPDHLKILIDLVMENKLDWACGSINRIRDGKNIEVKTVNPKNILINGSYFENFFQAWGYDLVGNTDGMLIKMEVLEKAGFFNEFFPVGEDLDLWFRIAHKNPRIGFCPEPTAEYNIRSGSLMDTIGPSAKVYFTLLQEHYNLAARYGDEYLCRFIPAARKLARWTFEEGIRIGDRQIMHNLINKYPNLLQWRLPLAYLAANIPYFIQAYDRYRRTGVRVKSLYR